MSLSVYSSSLFSTEDTSLTLGKWYWLSTLLYVVARVELSWSAGPQRTTRFAFRHSLTFFNGYLIISRVRGEENTSLFEISKIRHIMPPSCFIDAILCPDYART